MVNSEFVDEYCNKSCQPLSIGQPKPKLRKLLFLWNCLLCIGLKPSILAEAKAEPTFNSLII